MLARFIARAASAEPASPSGGWDSAVPAKAHSARGRLPLRQGARWLELGSGTGVVGLAAAVTAGCAVTLTDLAAAQPLILRNAEANAEAVAARGGSVSFVAFPWCVAASRGHHIFLLQYLLRNT